MIKYSIIAIVLVVVGASYYFFTNMNTQKEPGSLLPGESEYGTLVYFRTTTNGGMKTFGLEFFIKGNQLTIDEYNDYSTEPRINTFTDEEIATHNKLQSEAMNSEIQKDDSDDMIAEGESSTAFTIRIPRSNGDIMTYEWSDKITPPKSIGKLAQFYEGYYK